MINTESWHGNGQGTGVTGVPLTPGQTFQDEPDIIDQATITSTAGCRVAEWWPSGSQAQAPW